MNHAFKFIVLAFIACALFLTGCDQKDTLGWSPDGKHVAVLADDGIRVGDESGAISEKPSVPNKNIVILKWMPNSIDGLVVFKNDSKNWAEIHSLMSASERVRAVNLGQKLWTTRGRNAESLSKSDPGVALPALLYLHHKYGAKALSSRLGKSYANTLPVGIWNVELIDLANKVPSKKVLIWRGIEEIKDVQISPAGTLAAASVKAGLAHKIVALPLKGMRPWKEGTQPSVAVQSEADIPSWSADGKSLFYFSYPKINPETPIHQLYDDEHPYIATLNCLQITDDGGVLLSKFNPPRRIARVLAAHSSRVRCLPDGSAVFSGMPRKFPSIIDGGQPQEAFFVLSPDLQKVARIDTQKLPTERITEFELNQDATKIAISDKHGLVAVVDLAKGNVTTLQKPGKDEFRFSPKWRTKDELCYLRKFSDLAGPHQFEVVLQSMVEPDEARVLSKDWPEGLRSFLVTPHTESKEASAKEATGKRLSKKAVKADRNR